MKRCLHQSQHHGRSLLECSVGWLKGDDGLTKVTTPVRDTAHPRFSPKAAEWQLILESVHSMSTSLLTKGYENITGWFRILCMCHTHHETEYKNICKGDEPMAEFYFACTCFDHRVQIYRCTNPFIQERSTIIILQPKSVFIINSVFKIYEISSTQFIFTGWGCQKADYKSTSKISNS